MAFTYLPGGQTRATLHRKVEPYEIEFYERHLYLVAYTHTSRQTLDFRIDRIQGDTFVSLERLPPGIEHARRPIAFRYRQMLRPDTDIEERRARDISRHILRVGWLDRMQSHVPIHNRLASA